MKGVLKDFYAEDAYYKSLSEEEQIMKFQNWCERQGLSYELTFVDSASKYTRIAYFMLAAAFLITFLFKDLSDVRGYISPIAIIFWFLSIRRSPQIVSV